MKQTGASTQTQKIEESEREIFEIKLGETEREPKGQHLSRDEIEKKAKELAEERKKVESLTAEKLEVEMQESKQKLETEMLADKKKHKAKRKRLDAERIESERLAERKKLESEIISERKRLDAERLAERKKQDEEKFADKLKLEAETKRLEEERKKAESLAAEKLESEMQESKQKLETEMLADKKKLEAERKRLEEKRRESERIEAEMQESKQKLETEMLADKKKLEAERKRLEEKRKKVNRISNTLDNIIKSIYETIPTNHSSDLPSIHITQGTSNIYYDIEKLIENATGIVYIVTTLKDLSKMYHSNIPEKIKICEKNGGQIRLLTQVSSDAFLPFVNRFGATETRLGELNSKGRMIVEGGKQVIMSDVVWQDSGKQNTQYDYAICTDSSETVNNIFTLCSSLWEKFKTTKNSENSQAHYDAIHIPF